MHPSLECVELEVSKVIYILQISLPFLGLAAVGWIVFVVGFGGFNNDDTL